MQVIYILSLGHSGSTLLEYHLSQLPNAIGLGELYHACALFSKNNFKIENLEDYDQRVIDDCPFWKNLLHLGRSKNYCGNSMYQFVYDKVIERHFLENEIIIDSSKSLDGLKELIELGKHDIQVVLLSKDVRSWVTSSIMTSKRKNRSIRRFEAWYLFKTWYSFYQSCEKYLIKNGIKHISLSYDSFCKDHEFEVFRLERFIQKPLPAFFCETRSVNSINILGNRMRYNFDDNPKISYDTRWRSDHSWLLPYFFNRKIRLYNKRIARL
jgi:hypothetical protein